MSRRGFLGAILAASVVPAIVRADALMRVIPRRTVVLPQWWLAEEWTASLNDSEAHLIQIWNQGLASHWIERLVQVPEVSTIGVGAAARLAHRRFRPEALAVLAAFPERATIAAHEFDALHQQLGVASPMGASRARGSRRL